MKQTKKDKTLKQQIHDLTARLNHSDEKANEFFQSVFGSSKEEPGLFGFVKNLDKYMLSLHNLLIEKGVYTLEEFDKMQRTVSAKIDQEQRELEFARLGFVQVENATVENGDLMAITLSGTIDGEKADKDVSHLFVVGQNDHVEGFSEHFIGKKEGDLVEFVQPYPDEKKYQDYAGKKVFHKCEIKILRKPYKQDAEAEK